MINIIKGSWLEESFVTPSGFGWKHLAQPRPLSCPCLCVLAVARGVRFVYECWLSLCYTKYWFRHWKYSSNYSRLKFDSNGSCVSVLCNSCSIIRYEVLLILNIENCTTMNCASFKYTVWCSVDYAYTHEASIVIKILNVFMSHRVFLMCLCHPLPPSLLYFNSRKPRSAFCHCRLACFF